MRGIICYYSGTGNTALACQHIVNKVKNVDFDIFDVVSGGDPDLAGYDLVGFAAFADFLVPSLKIQDFIGNLPAQKDKPAFVFNTYGMNSGKTLQVLDRLAAEKGFRVVAGHSLHTPENFPPMIAGGMGNDKAPSGKEIATFKKFVCRLDDIAGRLAAGEDVPAEKIDIGAVNKVMPKYPKGMAKRMMGPKYFDKDLCTTCGTCANVCPNGAITIDGGPVFDEDKCAYCWACYNNCLFKAIFTTKYKGKSHYSGPSAELAEKLS